MNRRRNRSRHVAGSAGLVIWAHETGIYLCGGARLNARFRDRRFDCEIDAGAGAFQFFYDFPHAFATGVQ